MRDAQAAGVADAVEIIGTPDAVRRVSKAVKAAKRKAQKKARKVNR